MVDKPPKSMNAELKSVLRQISMAPPVRLRPGRDWLNRAGVCHNNVRDQVAAHGGQAQYGWIVRDVGAVFHFEFHCVWRDPAGALVDVTPPPPAMREMLFLPDPARTFDFDHRLTWTNRLWHRSAKRWSFEWKGHPVPMETVVVPRGIEG